MILRVDQLELKMMNVSNRISEKLSQRMNFFMYEKYFPKQSYQSTDSDNIYMRFGTLMKHHQYVRRKMD